MKTFVVFMSVLVFACLATYAISEGGTKSTSFEATVTEFTPEISGGISKSTIRFHYSYTHYPEIDRETAQKEIEKLIKLDILQNDRPCSVDAVNVYPVLVAENEWEVEYQCQLNRAE